MPGFPLVERGVPAVEAMLASKDPELLHHLYHEVKLAPSSVAHRCFPISLGWSEVPAPYFRPASQLQ